MLTESDLQSLHVKLGDRRKMLKSIALFQSSGIFFDYITSSHILFFLLPFTCHLMVTEMTTKAAAPEVVVPNSDVLSGLVHILQLQTKLLTGKHSSDSASTSPSTSTPASNTTSTSSSISRSSSNSSSSSSSSSNSNSSSSSNSESEAKKIKSPNDRAVGSETPRSNMAGGSSQSSVPHVLTSGFNIKDLGTTFVTFSGATPNTSSALAPAVSGIVNVTLM